MMQLGANLEFAKTDGLDLTAALKAAQQAGFSHVEPYVYSPLSLAVNSHLTLATTSDYHHIDRSTVDPDMLRKQLDALGISFSALDAHTSLLLPEIGVAYLKGAVDLADRVGCPIVMTDEGPLPTWLPLRHAFDILCYSLEAAITHAQRRNVVIAIELHNALTTQPDWLGKVLDRFGPTQLGVNFDTGNSFLAGNDPVAFLAGCVDRVVHVHAKDIPESMLPLRGQVTGTRVGVAMGQGQVDMVGILDTLYGAGYGGVVSIECDTLEQAKTSRTFFEQWRQRIGGDTTATP